MNCCRDRWECGGEFDWPDLMEQQDPPILPPESVLFGSGRDAIRAVLEHGMRTFGWKRCLLPCYYCGEVVSAIKACGIDIAWYEDLPTLSAPRQIPHLFKHDVVV